MTLAEIETRVKTQIRAEESSPSLNNLHDNSIAQWANEEVFNVILLLGNPLHFPALVTIDKSLTFSSGIAILPGDFWFPETKEQQEAFISSSLLSLKVTANSVTKRNVTIKTPNEFARQDSSNFVLTPTTVFPCGMIADKVHIKPTSITQGYLDYIEKHDTIDDSNGTQIDELGDNVLIQKILARYYDFRELPDLESKSLAMAEKIAKGN